MRWRWSWIIILWIGLCTGSLASRNAPIAADAAFIFSITNHQQQLYLNWQIAPHYYVYRDRIKFTTDPDLQTQIDYPQGILKYSQDLGRYEVYAGNLSIPVKLNLLLTPAKIKVSYQGCSEDGFC